MPRSSVSGIAALHYIQIIRMPRLQEPLFNGLGDFLCPARKPHCAEGHRHSILKELCRFFGCDNF
jgi:hypothetical protein